jgi:serine/threonine protein kinase
MEELQSSQASSSNLSVQHANFHYHCETLRATTANECSAHEGSQTSEFNFDNCGAGVYPLHLVMHTSQGTIAPVYRGAPLNVDTIDGRDVEVFLLTKDPGITPQGNESTLMYKLFQLPSYDAQFLQELEDKLIDVDKATSYGIEIRAAIKGLKNKKLRIDSICNASEHEAAMLRKATSLTRDDVRSFEATRKIGYVEDGKVGYEFCTYPDKIGYSLYSMPFYEGLNLISLCFNTVNLSLNFIVELMRKIIDAVSQLHQRGVAHCDLTPTNMILNCANDITMKVLSHDNLRDEKTLSESWQDLSKRQFSCSDDQILSDYLSSIIVRIIDFGSARDISERTQVLGSAYTMTAVVDLLLRRETEGAPINIATALHSEMPKKPLESYYNEEVSAVWLDYLGIIRCMAALLNVLPKDALIARQKVDIDKVFREIYCVENRGREDSGRIDGKLKLTNLLDRLDPPACSLSAVASLFSPSSEGSGVASIQQDFVPK